MLSPVSGGYHWVILHSQTIETERLSRSLSRGQNQRTTVLWITLQCGAASPSQINLSHLCFVNKWAFPRENFCIKQFEIIVCLIMNSSMNCSPYLSQSKYVKIIHEKCIVRLPYFYLNYKSHTFKQTKIYCSPWSVKGITGIFATERGSKSLTT